MNILNSMEAVFVATVALAGSNLFISSPSHCAGAQPIATSARDSMAVVIVKARRMNAEEKLQSVRAENAGAMERA